MIAAGTSEDQQVLEYKLAKTKVEPVLVRKLEIEIGHNLNALMLSGSVGLSVESHSRGVRPPSKGGRQGLPYSGKPFV